MNFRKANINDLERISDLHYQLNKRMAEIEPNYIIVTYNEASFIRNNILSYNNDYILIEENNKIIGFALVSIQDTSTIKAFKYYRYLYLIDLIIDPNYQNKGYGTYLYNYLKEYAKINGCSYIELAVLNNNKEAISFYEKQEMFPYMRIYRGNIKG